MLLIMWSNANWLLLILSRVLHGKVAGLLEVVEDEQEVEEDQIHLEERKVVEDCVTMVVVLPCLLSIVSDFVFHCNHLTLHYNECTEHVQTKPY